MKFTIINIANKMPSWVKLACDDYLTRINTGKYSCKIVEIKSNKNTAKLAVENMQLEAKKIIAQIPNDSFILVLDEHGRDFDSIKFANQLEKICLTNSAITLIIGGADGLHQEVKDLANLQMRLSSFTFAHGLVRVIILEQLYRAISILENHPYHRE